MVKIIKKLNSEKFDKTTLECLYLNSIKLSKSNRLKKSININIDKHLIYLTTDRNDVNTQINKFNDFLHSNLKNLKNYTIILNLYENISLKIELNKTDISIFTVTTNQLLHTTLLSNKKLILKTKFDNIEALKTSLLIFIKYILIMNFLTTDFVEEIPMKFLLKMLFSCFSPIYNKSLEFNILDTKIKCPNHYILNKIIILFYTILPELNLTQNSVLNGYISNEHYILEYNTHITSMLYENIHF